MKESLIEMMINMMPFMQPFMWIGVGFTAIGLVLFLAKVLFKTNTSAGLVWVGRILMVVAAFFILAQITGFFLGMSPKINFGNSAKLEFILVHFWQIGLAFLVIAIFLSFAGSSKRADTAPL